MEQVTEFFADLWQRLLRVADSAVDYLPNVLGALLVLLLAWLLARALRALTLRLLRALNRILDRVFAFGSLAQLRFTEPIIRFIGGINSLIVLVFGLEIATRVLEIEPATQVMDEIIAFVPKFVAGLTILVLGILASRVVRDAVTTAGTPLGRSQAAYLGRASQVATLVLGAVIALDQIRVDVQLPVLLIIVVAGAAMVGLSLAFGLGARDYTANLIAARQVAKHFQPGENVSVGAEQGVILEITSGFVIIDRADGRAVVPAARFLDTVVSVAETKPGKKSG